jgi:hypothetical protein
MASKSLVCWLKVSWESWRMSTWCAKDFYFVALCPPAAGGFAPPFIDQGEADYMRAMLSSYVGKCDVLCCRVGGRPDDPCSDLLIMAYLVPEQWRFEGRRAADGGDVL